MIYLKLFFTFFKIGAFTFGGGYAMLPLIWQEVIKANWLSREELIDFVAISESTPGPFAVNISTYVGSQTAGFFGAFFATLGVILPSFIIILLVAKAYEAFSKNRFVKGAMLGLKGSVVGLIATAVLSTFKAVFMPLGGITFNLEVALSLALFASMLFLLIKKVNPIIVIIISGVFGILIKAFIV